jgi:hypothetical protein
MSSLPAGLLLFDTGIYIRFSRGEKYFWPGEDAGIFQRTILTAVVAAELYARTHSQQEKRALDELCQAHRALGHFSTPSRSAWIDTGMLLRRSRSKWILSAYPAWQPGAVTSSGVPLTQALSCQAP